MWSNGTDIPLRNKPVGQTSRLSVTINKKVVDNMAVKDNQDIPFETDRRIIPGFLYKYYKLNDRNSERIFTENEIYFASPDQFNDPFDCRVQASFDATDGEWEEYLGVMMKNKHPELDYEVRSAFVRQLINSGWREDPGTKQKIVSDVQEAVNKIGVLCLSEVRDDILMWSHYADSHRGFCLQFNIKTTFYPFGELLFKVEYSSSYPQITVLRDHENQTRKVLLTKSDIWKHEKEWRILDPDNGPGIRIYPAEMLTGVIFGCEMPHESRQLIRKWAKGRTPILKFYQAIKKEAEFGLEIIKAIG
ncbi:MAG: DUF2971 domain-containing protein [Syntrophaceae bacterium]